MSHFTFQAHLSFSAHADAKGIVRTSLFDFFSYVRNSRKQPRRCSLSRNALRETSSSFTARKRKCAVLFKLRLVLSWKLQLTYFFRRSLSKRIQVLQSSALKYYQRHSPSFEQSTRKHIRSRLFFRRTVQPSEFNPGKVHIFLAVFYRLACQVVITSSIQGPCSSSIVELFPEFNNYIVCIHRKSIRACKHRWCRRDSAYR